MINDKTFPLKHVTTDEIGTVSSLANQLHDKWGFVVQDFTDESTGETTESHAVINPNRRGEFFRIDYTCTPAWSLAPKKDTKTIEKDARHIARFVAAVDPDFVLRMIKELNRLHDFERKAGEWKNNHDNQVAIARVLKERTDMPLERVNAYNKMKELEAENKRLKEENESLSSHKAIQHHTEMINYRMSDVDQKMNMLIGKFDQHFR